MPRRLRPHPSNYGVPFVVRAPLAESVRQVPQRHVPGELLDLESFNTLYEAQLLLHDWRLDYNHYRPTKPSTTNPNETPAAR